MLIYDVLRMDHKMVIDAFEAIEALDNPDRRKDVFRFIRTELTMHARAEEEVFYRPLRERVHGNFLLESAFNDHALVDSLLLELQILSAASPNWLDTARALRAALQRHIMKEEYDIFRIAEQHFTTLEAFEMGCRMLEEKGKLGMENPIHALGKKLKAKAKIKTKAA